MKTPKQTMSISIDSGIVKFIEMEHARTGKTKSTIVEELLLSATAINVQKTSGTIDSDALKTMVHEILKDVIKEHSQDLAVARQLYTMQENDRLETMIDTFNDVNRRLLSASETIAISEARVLDGGVELLAYAKGIECQSRENVNKVFGSVNTAFSNLQTGIEKTQNNLNSSVEELNSDVEKIKKTLRGSGKILFRGTVSLYSNILIAVSLLMAFLFADLSLKITYYRANNSLIFSGFEHLNLYLIGIGVIMIVIFFLIESVFSKVPD